VTYDRRVLIRTAVPDDALAVARVHVRTWQAAYRGLMPDAYLDGLRVEDRAARYTFGSPDPDRPRTLVAIEEGAIAGFATIGVPTSDDAAGGGELLALYVATERWGGGVGRALIAEARARLAARFTYAQLWVLDGNARAERFYAADGWAFDGTSREIDLWGGVRVLEHRWRRALTMI
jgi:ribosomal protein S18 acetylase RimI-like enzyme